MTDRDKIRVAFLGIIEEYGPALRRLTGAYPLDPADREDLFQEIAIALWRALPAFRNESSVRTWLYRIAHNVAITSSGKRRKIDSRRAPTEQSNDVHAPGRNPLAEALASEKRVMLLAAIHGLPDLDRQVIALHLEGLSLAEMEDVTGMTAGSLATRLSRIRARLTDAVRELQTGGNLR